MTRPALLGLVLAFAITWESAGPVAATTPAPASVLADVASGHAASIPRGTPGATGPTGTTGVAGVTGPTSATSAPGPAGVADIPGTTTQVLEVIAPTARASHAQIVAWQRLPDGSWQAAATAGARLGARGLRPASLRKQGSRTTPAGTFALGMAFGRAPAPIGTKLDYRIVTKADYWVYDPRDPNTYNRWVTGRTGARWRTGWAEHLVSYKQQYRHAVVIDYNFAASPGTPSLRAGGGIFLHVNGRGATAGCVSVSRANMVRLLRWLDPSSGPRIVIRSRS